MKDQEHENIPRRWIVRDGKRRETMWELSAQLAAISIRQRKGNIALVARTGAFAPQQQPAPTVKVMGSR